MIINQIAPQTTSQGPGTLFSTSGNMYAENLIIPNTCNSICNYAYCECSDITSLTIGTGVTSIGSYAFRNCTGISGALEIPDNVTEMSAGAFYGCLALTSVCIPNNITSLANSLFKFCSSIQSITLNNTLTSLYEYSLANCRALGSLTLPSSVTDIKSLALQNCVSLATLNLPASIASTVTSATGGSFLGCSNLEFITLGNGFHASVNFSSGTKYSAQTIVNMFNALYDFTDEQGTYYGQNATFTLGTANLTKTYSIDNLNLPGLSNIYVIYNDDSGLWEIDSTAYFGTENAKTIIEIATDKGWTVA